MAAADATTHCLLCWTPVSAFPANWEALFPLIILAAAGDGVSRECSSSSLQVRNKSEITAPSQVWQQDWARTPSIHQARGGNGSINYYSASASPHPSRTLQEFSHLLISNFVLCVELYLVYLVSQANSGICHQLCLLYVCLVNKVVWTIFHDFQHICK